MTYVISAPCLDVKDRACVDEFPMDCIYKRKRMLDIHPGECVDCGACEPVCPVEAIFHEDDLPDGLTDFTRLNSEFFGDIGSPGGASFTNLVDVDHAEFAAMAPAEGALL